MNIKTELYSDSEWIELKPYGIAVGTLETRPIFMLKNESKNVTLPVWLLPQQVVDTLAGAEGSHFPSGPHKITQEIFNSLGLKVEKCLFVELRGHHQYVDLYFKGHPEFKKMRFRASEAIPLCLQMGSEFFAQREFIESCRQMDAEVFSGDPNIDSHQLLKRVRTDQLN